jgi:hypothetical protein
MGVDYALVNQHAELYLDRGKPFREPIPMEVGDIFNQREPDPVRASDARAFKRPDVPEGYPNGAGWLEAVATWLEAFGPCLLLDDHRHSTHLTTLYLRWKVGDFRRFELSRDPTTNEWRVVEMASPRLAP